MPDNKNQHFVPRCHLKPFSIDGRGKAIRLYNIASDRSVGSAAISGQCAKDYFYGSGDILEPLFQHFEGNYARIVRSLHGSDGQPTTADLHHMRAFTYLQYWRTQRAAHRMLAARKSMDDALFEGRLENSGHDKSERAMVMAAMRQFATSAHIVEDLKPCIVVNDTAIDFITSDDPSIFTSRFHVQTLRSNSFGIGSSGTLFFLPLTPRRLFMCYDSDVYTVPERRGFYLRLESDRDISALNDLQYLKAAENIYFTNWSLRDQIAQQFRGVSSRRPKSWAETAVFVASASDDERTRYRRATDSDRTGARRELVELKFRHIEPTKWISKLRFRSPPKTYSNGSAAGHVRRKFWDERFLDRVSSEG